MARSTDPKPGAASRRTFLAGAGLAGASAGVGVLAGAAGAAPATRTYTAGRFAIELDGVAAGAPLHGAGGHPYGDVANEPAGPDHIIHKHIAGVKYEDITVSCGIGMSKPFYNWIKASFDNKQLRHSGRLTSRAQDNTVVDAVSFTDALLSEVTFPALDAASKDAAKLTVTMRPETTQGSKAGPRQTVSQKLWHGANFRLDIAGADCSRVATIDSFTWKAVLEDDGKGTLVPTEFDISNLVITTPPSHAQDFYDWFAGHVLDNKNDERTGTLTYLTPSGHDLFTVKFTGLGIWSVDAAAPQADKIRRVNAEMYCEELSFEASSAAWA